MKRRTARRVEPAELAISPSLPIPPSPSPVPTPRHPQPHPLQYLTHPHTSPRRRPSSTIPHPTALYPHQALSPSPPHLNPRPRLRPISTLAPASASAQVGGNSLVMSNMFTLAFGLVPTPYVSSVWSSIASWGLEQIGDYGAFWYQVIHHEEWMR